MYNIIPIHVKYTYVPPCIDQYKPWEENSDDKDTIRTQNK